MADITKIVYGGDMMIFTMSGATGTPLAFSTSANLNINTDSLEISSKDSGYNKDFQAGKLSWDVSTDGLLNFEPSGSTQGIETLYAKQVAREYISIAFAHKTGTTPDWTVDTSKKRFTGQGIITSLTLNASDNTQGTYSITIQGTGALTLA